MIFRLLSRQWSATLAFGVSFVTYVVTLCPTVYVEGSGELIGAVYALGTPHPTGYPLFTLVGRLFSAVLPFDSVALRINTATALTASLAVAALAVFLRDRGCHPWASVGGALVLAFSTTFWSNAVVAEVYGLGMLGTVAIVGLTVRTGVVDDRRGMLLAAYVTGIALTTHLSQSLILPGVAILWLWRWYRASADEPLAKRTVGLLRLSTIAVAAAATGFTLVVYLVIRSQVGPGFHWGPVDRIDLFWNHITGAEYRSAFFSTPVSGILLNANRWGQHLISEYNAVLCLMAVWGVWVTVRRDRAVMLVTGSTVVVNLLVALNYHRDPNGIGVFFLLSFWGTAVFLAYGLDDIIRRVGRVVGAVIVAVAILSVMVTNLGDANRSEVRIARHYGMDILNSLPQDAILITEGDDASFIVDYLQRVEGVRPDVTIYMRAGRGTDVLHREARYLNSREKSIMRRRMEKKIVQQSEDGRPVFFLVARGIPVDGFDFIPSGLLYEIKRKGGKTQVGEILPDTTGVAIAGPFVDPWSRIIQGNYWFKRGDNHFFRDQREEAIYCFERAADIAHDSRTMRYNVALRLLSLEQHEGAWSHVRAAIQIDPMMPQVYKLARKILRRAGREDELPAVRAEEARWTFR